MVVASQLGQANGDESAEQTMLRSLNGLMPVEIALAGQSEWRLTFEKPDLQLLLCAEVNQSGRRSSSKGERAN
jgi:hypothetical protein